MRLFSPLGSPCAMPLGMFDTGDPRSAGLPTLCALSGADRPATEARRARAEISTYPGLFRATEAANSGSAKARFSRSWRMCRASPRTSAFRRAFRRPEPPKFRRSRRFAVSPAGPTIAPVLARLP